jgi:hypothetical protein
MIGFVELEKRLVGIVRTKVLNGESTERGLAKLLRISQPHIHNVLKGIRNPSSQLCDQILRVLHLTVEDLLEKAVDGSGPQVNLLNGYLGPGYPWPEQVSDHRIVVPPSAVSGIKSPVAARLGTDIRMSSAFRGGEIVVLDQSLDARASFDPDGLYLIKQEGAGLIRKVQRYPEGLLLFSTDAVSQPGTWERVNIAPRQFPQVVRARARMTIVLQEWL